jgi:predicted amidohydrolase YtcJ
MALVDRAAPPPSPARQRITVEEALRAYTTGAAFASFEESTKGSLAAGKLADLVVLDRDLFTLAPERIREIRVVATVVGGRVVYGELSAAAH